MVIQMTISMCDCTIPILVILQYVMKELTEHIDIRAEMNSDDFSI